MGKRRGLGPRNNVVTTRTCKAATLRVGQQIIAVFRTANFLIEARSKPAEEII